MLRSMPQATLAYKALGRVLAERGDLAGAQVESEKALSVRKRFPAHRARARCASPARQMAQSVYVAPIYPKLGVSSRAQAVNEAHARGLI